MLKSAVRNSYLFLIAAALFFAGKNLEAYPVNITINATFVEIPGQADPLGLGTANPPYTATITTTLQSSLPLASYPATLTITIPGVLTNAQNTGTISISPGGQISSTFSGTSGNFSAVLQLPLTFPNPVPLAFGTASFSSPASSVSYDLFGESGKVGVNGTISALGLTASPASLSATYTSGGAAPAPASISVKSNDPSNPAQAFTASVSGSVAPYLTLNPTSGTTNATLMGMWSTTAPPGTYTGTVNISSGGGAPLTIPVTYTVNGSGGGGGGTQPLAASPSALNFSFFAPGSTSETLTLSVTSTPSTTYTASITAGGNFLSVANAAGSTPGSVSVTAHPGSLTAGSYSGSISISSPSAGTITVPVTLTIGSGSGGGGGSSTLTVLPTLVRFTYAVGGAIPPPQGVSVQNSTPVSFSVGNVQFYAPVSPTSGTTPAIINVSLNPSGLTPGSYTDNLQIQASNGSSYNLPVIVTVLSAAPNTLSASPAALTFAYSGPSSTGLTQTVSLTGTSALNFNATSSVPWLSVSPAIGATPATLTITAKPAGLAVGTYTGSISVASSSASNSPLLIAVTFNVTAAQPAITASPAAVAFAYQTGGTAPATQTLTISGAATGITVAAVGAPWLTATATSDPTMTTLSADPTGLAPGVYFGSLKVTSTTGNAPLYLPVSLTIANGMAIGVSSQAITFNSGGPVPYLSQALGVATSDGSSFTVSGDASWLQLSATTISSGTLTITVNPNGIVSGFYTAHVTLTSTSLPQGSTTVPSLSIPVTLYVGPFPTPMLNAVDNGISFQGETGAPGSIVALWGQGLGPTTAVPLVLTSSNTISTSVGGTQVYADGIPCPILFSSNGQVNAILPYALANQTTADIQLYFQGAPSAVIPLAIQPATPAIFTSNASGAGQGSILNQDLSINSALNPAPAGTIIAIYGGGAGASNPPNPDGLLISGSASLPAPVLPVAVTIAGQQAQVNFSGAAPGLVNGIVQINATIPQGTPSGPQPVQFSVGSAMSQANVTVYVQ